MTQSTTSTTPDPWAAASVAPQGQQADAGQSSLAGSYQPAPAGPSKLFQQGSVAPGLFNKAHHLGTVREGIITKAPVDKHDQDYNEKKPKYWSTSKVGNKAFTCDPIDGPTGQLNRPVMVTHIELDTQYGQLTREELLAMERDPETVAGADGKRVFVVRNQFEYKAFQDAILDAISRGIKVTCDKDLVGLKLIVKRARKQPNQGGNPSWDPDIRLDRA